MATSQAETPLETGSLTEPSRREKQRRFIGSSSGVYFINIVKQAFEATAAAAAAAQGQHPPNHLPDAEETVGGEDDFAPSPRNSPEINTSSQRGIEIKTLAHLGALPPYQTARQLMIEYFATWHPIVPFLSGPAFLLQLDALYQHSCPHVGLGRIPADRQQLCNLIIFQCVLATGAAGLPTPPADLSAVPSISDLLSLLASFASTHDLLTIQTLLAAQVYCLSSLALRPGGLLCKLLYHAGLHRCPYRYPQLSNEDRDLRKRILWSAYAIDRYLCQALGIPVTLSDAEIDVCLSGRQEEHGMIPTDRNGMPITPGLDENARVGTCNITPEESSSPASTATTHRTCQNRTAHTVNKLEVILANFVEYGRLAGRAMQLYHISVNSRSTDPRGVLFLRSDVDKWFNSMPEEPSSADEGDGADQQVLRFLPFLHVLYEQLKISIHRPSLSLPRSMPEFHHSLQVTIRSAKRTLLAMERQSQLFWPGYVASVWMSGLVLSFACLIGMYNTAQGSQEIVRCLDLLKRMSQRWASAERCHAALSTLLSDLLQAQKRHDSNHNDDDILLHPSKRQRRDDVSTEPERAASSNMLPTSQLESVTATSGSEQNDDTFIGGPSSATNFNEADVNDFFQGISWENLSDIGDIVHPSSDMRLFAR